MMLKQM